MEILSLKNCINNIDFFIHYQKVISNISHQLVNEKNKNIKQLIQLASVEYLICWEHDDIPAALMTIFYDLLANKNPNLNYTALYKESLLPFDIMNNWNNQSYKNLQNALKKLKNIYSQNADKTQQDFKKVITDISSAKKSDNKQEIITNFLKVSDLLKSENYYYSKQQKIKQLKSSLNNQSNLLNNNEKLNAAIQLLNDSIENDELIDDETQEAFQKNLKEILTPYHKIKSELNGYWHQLLQEIKANSYNQPHNIQPDQLKIQQQIQKIKPLVNQFNNILIADTSIIPCDFMFINTKENKKLLDILQEIQPNLAKATFTVIKTAIETAIEFYKIIPDLLNILKKYQSFSIINIMTNLVKLENEVSTQTNQASFFNHIIHSIKTNVFSMKMEYDEMLNYLNQTNNINIDLSNANELMKIMSQLTINQYFYEFLKSKQSDQNNQAFNYTMTSINNWLRGENLPIEPIDKEAQSNKNPIQLPKKATKNQKFLYKNITAIFLGIQNVLESKFQEFSNINMNCAAFSDYPIKSHLDYQNHMLAFQCLYQQELGKDPQEHYKKLQMHWYKIYNKFGRDLLGREAVKKIDEQSQELRRSLYLAKTEKTDPAKALKKSLINLYHNKINHIDTELLTKQQAQAKIIQNLKKPDVKISADLSEKVLKSIKNLDNNLEEALSNGNSADLAKLTKMQNPLSGHSQQLESIMNSLKQPDQKFKSKDFSQITTSLIKLI